MPEEDDTDRPAHIATRRAPRQEPLGVDMGRILALTDGVFAFALTLLVLSLTVPVIATQGIPTAVVSGNLGSALWQARGTFAAYVFVFVMIAIWWVSHHRVFRYIIRYDDALVWMNLALLIEIAVMPYVLKVYITYIQTRVATDLFAAVEMITGLTIGLIWLYAGRGHRLIARDFPELAVSYFNRRLLLSPLVFAISIGVSYVSVTGAEITWVGVFVAVWFSRHVYATNARRENAPRPGL